MVYTFSPTQKSQGKVFPESDERRVLLVWVFSWGRVVFPGGVALTLRSRCGHVAVTLRSYRKLVFLRKTMVLSVWRGLAWEWRGLTWLECASASASASESSSSSSSSSQSQSQRPKFGVAWPGFGRGQATVALGLWGCPWGLGLSGFVGAKETIW